MIYVCFSETFRAKHDTVEPKLKLRKFNTSSVSAIPLRLPILLVFAFVAATALQGTRGLCKTTEGRYAECAREMAQAGTWLEPVLNGQPHWTKPPLTYIAMIAPFKVFGPTTWAARLYLIPCYLITIVGVWWLALRLWKSREYADISALVYATSAFPMIASHVISTDCLLTAALALTQAAFWEALRKRSRWAIHLIWFFLGIAFMIKGPPALLVVPAMIAVWARLPREIRRQVPLFSFSAILLFFVVGFGWYAFEAIQHPGLANYWLHDEVVARSFTKGSHRNPEFYKNFELYLPPFLFGTFPWSAWLIYRWRTVRDLILLTGTKKRNWKKLSDETFWLLWAVILPVLVFTFSRSKLPFYILPLFVPFAVAAGRILFEIDGRKPWFGKYVLRAMCIMFLFFIFGKAVAGVVLQEKDMARLHRQLTEDFGVVNPKNVAVFGHSHPNGLSFYYNDSLRLLSTVEELDAWMKSKGSQFLLCHNPREEVELDEYFLDLPIKKQTLNKEWRLYRFPEGSELFVSNLEKNAKPFKKHTTFFIPIK